MAEHLLPKQIARVRFPSAPPMRKGRGHRSRPFRIRVVCRRNRLAPGGPTPPEAPRSAQRCVEKAVGTIPVSPSNAPTGGHGPRGGAFVWLPARATHAGRAAMQGFSPDTPAQRHPTRDVGSDPLHPGPPTPGRHPLVAAPPVPPTTRQPHGPPAVRPSSPPAAMQAIMDDTRPRGIQSGVSDTIPYIPAPSERMPGAPAPRRRPVRLRPRPRPRHQPARHRRLRREAAGCRGSARPDRTRSSARAAVGHRARPYRGWP